MTSVCLEISAEHIREPEASEQEVLKHLISLIL